MLRWVRSAWWRTVWIVAGIIPSSRTRPLVEGSNGCWLIDSRMLKWIHGKRMLSPSIPTSRSLMMGTMMRMWWGCRRSIRPAFRSLMRHWSPWWWRITTPTGYGRVRKLSSLIPKRYSSIKIWNVISNKRWREGTNTTCTGLPSWE